VNLANLPSLYQQQFGKKLDPKAYGHQKLIVLLGDVAAVELTKVGTTAVVQLVGTGCAQQPPQRQHSPQQANRQATQCTPKKQVAQAKQCTPNQAIQVKQQQRQQSKQWSPAKQVQVPWKKQQQAAKRPQQQQQTKLINSFVNAQRQQMVAAQTQVTVAGIVERTCSYFAVNRFDSLGVGRPFEIPAISNIETLESKLHAQILSFFSVNSICTLYDLELELCECHDVQSYDELKMGPLLKHPIVIRQFKPSAMVSSIPHVSIDDVVGILADSFRSGAFFKHQKSRVEPKDFANMVAAKLQVASPLDLCLRVRSLGLFIKCVSDSLRRERDKMKQIRTKLREEADVNLKVQVTALKAKLEAAQQDKECSEEALLAAFVMEWSAVFACMSSKKAHAALVDAYVDTKDKHGTGTNLLCHVAEAFVRGGGSSHMASSIGVTIEELESVMLSKYQELESCPQSLMDCVELLCALSGHVQKHFMLKDFEALGHGTFLHFLEKGKFGFLQAILFGKTDQKSSLTNEVESSELEACCKKELEGMSPLSFDDPLTFLEQLDHNVADQFGVDDFSQLNKGSLVAFACSCGGLHDLIISACLPIASGAVEEAQTFLAQLAQNLNLQDDTLLADSTQEMIQAAMCSQFGFHKFEDMRLGSLESLVQHMAMVAGPTAQLTSKSVLYGGALGRPLVQIQRGEETSSAISSLDNAPYLANLIEWTQWEVAFEKEHGDLKLFISKHCCKSLMIVEVAPRHWVKIDPEATAERLSTAAKVGGVVATATQLVSIAVKSGGLQHTPVSLMSTYLATALRGLERPYRFVLEVLCAMPATLAVHFVRLFERASKDIDSNRWATAMLKACQDQRERSLLHKAGIVHGIDEWLCDFREQCLAAPCSDEKEAPGLGDPTVQCTQTETHRAGNEDDDSGSTDERATITPENVTIKNGVAEATVGDEGKQAAHAKRFIEELRLKRFGENEGESSEIKMMLDRAVSRLSKDLYSTDTHFVMELIQNADDNEYEEGVCPELSFVLTEEAITCYNNETGFHQKHVNALCNVADSSKGSGGTGYIGQKGIGFKAVFRVSDFPEIHSNGYHFGFDGPVSMIKPESVAPRKMLGKWGTMIYLPRKSCAAEEAEYYFADLKPTLLLFLGKLRKITIQDQFLDCRSMTRSSLEGGIVELSDTTGEKSRWLISSQRFEVPEVVRRHPTQTSSAISIGICLTTTEGEARPQQPVFAFLPISSYGFRFVLQADFVVPASRCVDSQKLILFLTCFCHFLHLGPNHHRETLVETNAFNQWAVSHVPTLFAKVRTPSAVTSPQSYDIFFISVQHMYRLCPRPYSWPSRSYL
jgi:hypothetical protein